MNLVATKGVNNLYLIKRKPTTSRDELVMHWYHSHMPAVIKKQEDAKASGKPYARRYTVTLFDRDTEGNCPWDGIAKLLMTTDSPEDEREVLRRPDTPHGTVPTDTFQERAVPYMTWPTTEYVVLDGSKHLSADTYPTTRSGFFRVSFLVKAKPGTDYNAFFAHWLNVHVPNVKNTLEWIGGFRYMVNHSIEPEESPFAGLAELYFTDRGGWEQYRKLIKPDGMDEWVDRPSMQILFGTTELIAIP